MTHAQSRLPIEVMRSGPAISQFQATLHAPSYLRADFGQVQVHHFAVGGRHYHCGADTTLPTDGAKDVGRIVLVIAHHQRPRAPNANRSTGESSQSFKALRTIKQESQPQRGLVSAIVRPWGSRSIVSHLDHSMVSMAQVMRMQR